MTGQPEGNKTSNPGLASENVAIADGPCKLGLKNMHP